MLIVVDTAPAQSFRTPAVYPAGWSTYAVAFGHFNGDDNLDMAIVNNGGKTVSVFFNGGDGSFGQRIDYPLSLNPIALSVADFNGDGKSDLVTVNAFRPAGVVDVLLNKGDGTFSPAVSTPLNQFVSPHKIGAGDLNGDGKVDIVVPTQGTSLKVLLGNGDGTFKPPTDYVIGDYCASVTIADFNADSKPDLAVTGYGGDDGIVGILLGKGDGTFSGAVTYGAGPHPTSITSGDYNGDGKIDLVTANMTGYSVSVLAGNGDGSFRSKTDFSTNAAPYSVESADFNSDGKLDVAVGGNAAFLGILSGDGSGSFAPEVGYETVAPMLAVGDLNGDARPDLAAGFRGAQDIRILLNKTGPLKLSGTVTDSAGAAVAGVRVRISDSLPANAFTGVDGKFQIAGLTVGSTLVVTASKINYTFAPANITLGNLSSDAAADFTGTLRNYQIRGTVRQSGGGPPLAGVSVTLSDGVNSRTTSTGADGGFTFTDVAGNRDYSVAVSLSRYVFSPPILPIGNLSSNLTNLFFSGTLQTFTIGGTVKDQTGGGGVNNVLVTLNGSRNDSTLVQSGGAYSFANLPIGGDYTVTVSRPIGGFANFSLSAPFSRTFTNLAANQTADFNATVYENVIGESFVAVVPGDLNGDGKLDLVVSRRSGTALQVLLGRGDGTFDPAVDFEGGSQSVPSLLVDLNDDGKLDLVARAGSAPQLRIWLGRGDGTFQNQTVYTVTLQTYPFAFEDLNGDGKLDFIVADFMVNRLFVYPGTGEGTFDNPTTIENVLRASLVRAADFNADGRQDFAVISYADQTLTFFINTPNGTYVTGAKYSIESAPQVLQIVDVNKDGKPDVVTGKVTLLGNGDGTFKPPVTYSGTVAYNKVITADLNGDGALDLVASNYTGEVVFYGVGDGTFQPPKRHGATNFSTVAVGDFNQDGRVDLLGVRSNAGQNDASITVLVNTGAAPSMVLHTDGGTNRVVALQTVTSMREPFGALMGGNISAGERLRLSLFCSGVDLPAGANTSSIQVQAESQAGLIYPLTVEYVHRIPNVAGLIQIVVRWPAELSAAGDYWITLTTPDKVSNRAAVKVN